VRQAASVVIVFTCHNQAKGGGEGHVGELSRLCATAKIPYFVLGHGDGGGAELDASFSVAQLSNRRVRHKLREASVLFLHGGPRDLLLALWCRCFSRAVIWLQLHVSNTPSSSWRAAQFVANAVLWVLTHWVVHRVIRVSSNQNAPLKHMEIIPPLTDLDRLSLNGSFIAGRKSEKLNVLFCGRAPGVDESTDSKGWLRAIEVLKHLRVRYPTITISHCGGGTLTNLMKKACLEAGIQLNQTAWEVDPFAVVSEQQTPACLFLLSQSESYGLCVVEAQYVGLPSIISDAIPDDAILVPELCLRVEAIADPVAVAGTCEQFLDTVAVIDRASAIVYDNQLRARAKYLDLLRFASER